eukprot:c18494_g1_i1 orf=465-1004(+)
MWTKNMVNVHPFLGLKIVPDIIAEMNEKGQTLSMSFKDAADEEVIRPKPQHPVPAPFQSLAKPFRRLRGTTSLPPEREAGLEILDILLSKANSGSFTSHYMGSPPCRAGNPLIHDAHFSQKPALPSPVNISQKSPSLFGGISSAKSTINLPARGSKSFVRIEGFMPSNGESRQGIRASA